MAVDCIQINWAAFFAVVALAQDGDQAQVGMATPGARVYPIAGHACIAARLYGFGPLAFRAAVGDGAGANGHGISRCAGARAALCGRCPTG